MPKRCTKCGTEKDKSEFSRASRESDGLQDWCKSCHYESSRAALLRRREMNGAESVLRPIADHVAGGVAWCGTCKTDLPIIAFGKRVGRCKACACRLAKEARERMIALEETLPPDSPKRCGACKETKTLADFQRGTRNCRECQNQRTAASTVKHHDKKLERGKRHYAANKDKRADDRKRHRAENPEWWREWEKRYNKTEKGSIVRRNITHKRREAVKESTMTADQMLEVKSKAKGRCHYCRKKSKSLEFDHVTPIARGGKHALDNLVMACQSCNRSKSASDPMEFAKKQGSLLI